jgi:predicted DNA-binding protein with PD1-like motif
MTFRSIPTGYLIRLFKGEKIMEQLVEFCRQRAIYAGQISGIGGVTNAEIAFYNLDSKKYQLMTYEQTLEITSLLGNVSELDGEPFLHVHINLADEQGRTFGGHLKEAIIGGTGEIFLHVFSQTVTRANDPETGLNLWQLD